MYGSVTRGGIKYVVRPATESLERRNRSVKKKYDQKRNFKPKFPSQRTQNAQNFQNLSSGVPSQWMHSPNRLYRKSHDQDGRSHDLGKKSHDQGGRSHDLGEKSHDQAGRSHDLREYSHDTASMTNETYSYNMPLYDFDHQSYSGNSDSSLEWDEDLFVNSFQSPTVHTPIQIPRTKFPNMEDEVWDTVLTNCAGSNHTSWFKRFGGVCSDVQLSVTEVCSACHFWARIINQVCIN